MKSSDILEQARNDFAEKVKKELEEGTPETIAQAITEFAGGVEKSLKEEIAELKDAQDGAILQSRGVRVLTAKEKSFYESVLSGMKSSAPKQALADIDEALPISVLERVFEDLVKAHPLLEAVDFQNTGILTKIILSSGTSEAEWGGICDPITQEAAAAFVPLDLTSKKLSAFVPVCNTMLDEGPEWLDRYVREILAEALANGLEKGIIDGDGDGKPIGMNRKITGAVDDVYPLKDAIVIEDLSPKTVGEILKDVATIPGGGYRPVPELLLVVNPADYYTQVFPATTAITASGEYAKDVLPYNIKVVQSAYVPVGRAVAGLGKKYLMGVGTGKEGKLEYSDEFKFLDDMRTYRIKLIGNGQALDENAFVYLDISGGLKPAVTDVKVTNFPEPVKVEVENFPEQVG
jgi:hypothetical protein